MGGWGSITGTHPPPAERSQTGHAPVHLDQDQLHISHLCRHTGCQVLEGIAQLGALGVAWGCR